jgi:Ca-activated chloride channel homolog
MLVTGGHGEEGGRRGEWIDNEEHCADGCNPLGEQSVQSSSILAHAGANALRESHGRLMLKQGCAAVRRSFFLFLISSAALLSAQTAFQAGAGVDIRVNTTLVVIPVTVTDSLNRFVLGLDKQDFRVFEDGAEQKVKQFADEDAPLSIGMLVDTSGSMGSKIETSRQAVAQFLKTMNAQDEAFLVAFGDRAELATGFTQHPDEIQSKLTSVEPQGLTALLDAVYMGLREMKRAKNPRKALLIISDGGDNNSRYTANQIENLVREADVQIYSMGVFGPLSYLGISAAELSGPHLLSQLSEQTGGRAFAAANDSALPSIAASIGIELRNQYVLAYSPTNQNRDGKYRKVEVKLDQPQDLPALKSRWRIGYYAPSQ